jgi:hypothetical protein
MYKMIFAAVAVALPLTSFSASAAVTPAHVWNELGSMPATQAPAIIRNDGSAIRTAEPGHYLAVLTQAETNRLDRACNVALQGGYSAATVEFCHFLKDEIEAAEADDSN